MAQWVSTTPKYWYLVSGKSAIIKNTHTHSWCAACACRITQLTAGPFCAAVHTPNDGASRVSQVKPHTVHGFIGMAGFGPYFALEGFGISLPYIGFANIDPTYSLDGLTQMLIFFLAS